MFRSALQAAAPGHEEADDLFEPDAISDDEPILALKDAPPGEPKDPKAAPEAGEHGPEAAADYESMKDTLLKTGQKVHSSEGFDFYFWRGDNPGEKNLFAMPLTKRRRVTKGSIVCQITGGKCEAVPEPFDGPDQLMWNPGKQTKVYFKDEITSIGAIIENNAKVDTIYGKGKLSPSRTIPKKCLGDSGEAMHFCWSPDKDPSMFRYLKESFQCLFAVKISDKMLMPQGVVFLTVNALTCDSAAEPQRMICDAGLHNACQAVVWTFDGIYQPPAIPPAFI